MSGRAADRQGDDRIVVTRAQVTRLLTYVHEAIVAVDDIGTITFVSPGITSVTGHDPQTVLGRNMAEFLHPEDNELAARMLENWGGRSGAAPVPTIRVRVASGEWVPMTMDAILGPEVAPFGAVVVTFSRADAATDAEHQLRQRLINQGRLVRLASTFVNLAPEHMDHGVRRALEEMGDMAGVDRVEVVRIDPETDELINTHEWTGPGIEPLFDPDMRMPIEDIPLLRAILRHDEVAIPSVESLVDEWRTERAWFRNRGVGSAVAVPLSDQGRVIGFIGFEAVGREFAYSSEHLLTLRSAAGILAQAFARHAVEERLAYQGRHDPLTGLPNRWAFLEMLGRAAARLPVDPGTGDAGGVAVLLFDLDRFKIINDSLGHGVGDDLLITIARRMAEAIPAGATLARMGGDELVVLLEGATRARAEAVAADLRRVVGRAVDVEGHKVATTTSVGIAHTTDAGESADDLLRHADAAMYAAKELGRDRIEVFDESLRGKVRRRLQDELELRHAIESGELEVYYQAEVDVPAGQVCGAEALLRWNHPTRGLLTAADFIDLAEETGLIIDLGLWVLRQACEQQVAWQARFPERPIVVRVNLSARQIGEPSLLVRVMGIVRDTGIQPAHLCLEITETAVMADAEASLEVLEKLRGLGVELAIDDFGTGYSSLNYLKRFPVHVVKVDRSFVDGLGVDSDDTAIVQAIMVLAASLGLAVTAEGVETDVQLRELERLGCRRVQGFYFARPEPAEAFSARLADGA